MGFGSFLKKAVKGLGKVAKIAAPVVGLTGVGLPWAAGLGALGGLASGGGKGALEGAAMGAGGSLAGKGLSALGGLGSVAGKIGQGLGAFSGATGGAGSWLDGLTKAGGLVAGGLAIKDQRNQRKEADQYNQQRLDVINQLTAKAEKAYDEKAPLRAGGQQAILQALAQGPGPYQAYLDERKSGKRKAGEYQD